MISYDLCSVYSLNYVAYLLCITIHCTLTVIAGSSIDLSEVTFLLAAACGMLLMAPSQLKRTSGILYLMLVVASAFILIVFWVHHGEL